MITGGTGTLGRALIDLMHTRYDRVSVVSRDEVKQNEQEGKHENVRYFLGDVRDIDRITRLFKNVTHVIHAAALKQVPRCEYNPFESIYTNILGTANVIQACLDNDVERAVFVSTDKSVEPINLYGATKLCGEKQWMASNAYNNTSFNVVRYGNVIGSRGSVIELAEGKDKIPLTDDRMTRFWIKKEDAALLVSYALGQGPGVYIPTMEKWVVWKYLRELYPSAEFEVIGIRPGEKIHESIIGQGEVVNEVSWDFSGHIQKKGPMTSECV